MLICIFKLHHGACSALSQSKLGVNLPRVIDLTGGACSTKVPNISSATYDLNFHRKTAATLQYVQDTLVFCNIKKMTDQNSHICIGTKKSSDSWVILPPKLDDSGIQSSLVVNDSILLISYRAPVASLEIKQVPVDIKGYIGDYHGGCPLYDEQNNRIIFVNKGKVRVLDFTGIYPKYTVLTNKMMVRTHSGCTFATVTGKRSLVVAGGVSYYTSKETTATTSTTVEYIAVDDIEQGKPKLIQPLIVNHARKPSVTQIGT